MSLYNQICALKDSTTILRATSATKRCELLHCFAQKLLDSRIDSTGKCARLHAGGSSKRRNARTFGAR